MNRNSPACWRAASKRNIGIVLLLTRYGAKQRIVGPCGSAAAKAQLYSRTIQTPAPGRAGKGAQHRRGPLMRPKRIACWIAIRAARPVQLSCRCFCRTMPGSFL
jgi:hypothetical protein